MGEPTVTVTQQPCPTCGGSGEPEPIVSMDKFQRTMSVGGICPDCKGGRKIVRQVPLSELRELLADPSRFAGRP